MGQHLRILLGVTGGIAAYKAVYLVRRLKELGHDVLVVMTPSAEKFVTPLTFQAISGRPVQSDLWEARDASAMDHIELARFADLFVVAPATAGTLARFATGDASDLLTAIHLASRAPLLVAPAMNQAMWHHPATSANVATLKARGATFIGPASGLQACGDDGFGRMVEPDAIVEAILARAHVHNLLKGVRVLITAGPTREPIDPVRFLSNRSSGQMAYALAEALSASGALVTLVTGQTALSRPPLHETIEVTTAQEMFEAVMAHVASSQIFIGAAAVADYRPSECSAVKLAKEHVEWTLKCVLNPDIIAQVASLQEKPFVVGFAAQSEDVASKAREKRVRKGMDMIIANDVAVAMETARNAVTVITDQYEKTLPLMDKKRLAYELITMIANDYYVSTNPKVTVKY